MTRCAAILAALCTLAPLARAQAPFQRGVVVSPESVTVGDPFRVVIRVRAPLGTVLDFPEGPDTTQRVEPLDRVVLADAGDSSAVEVTATYRLAAWDVGRRALRFDDILATLDGQTRRIAVGTEWAVTVVSVLPADTAQRVPRPPRPVYEFGLPWWWWAVVILALALLGALFAWWWRRRPVRRAPPADPHADAVAAFARVEALGLVAAGEGGHHVTLVTDIVREYLARTRPGARVAQTTSEMLQALRADRLVPLTRLSRVLHDADLVKFAQRRSSATEAAAHGTECRALVEAVHAALNAPTATEARAA